MGNILAALAYPFGWLGGLIIFLLSKGDKVARFHGLQSIFLSITIGFAGGIFGFIAGIIGAIIAITSPGGQTTLPPLAWLAIFASVPLIFLLFFIVAVWCMYQAFSNKIYKLPVIGNFAERYA